MVHKRTFGALVTVLAVSIQASAQPKFIGIGDLPGGSFRSRALGVSSDGHTVVGAGRGVNDRLEAILWTDPEFGGIGMIGLGYFPHASPLGFGHAVSADARVVVGWSLSENGQEAFRWTDPAHGGNGMIGLGELPGHIGTRFFESHAWDVSDDGEVVVGIAGNDDRAFIWTDPAKGGSGMVELDTPLGHHSEANAVSRDGSIVVGQAENLIMGGFPAFRWHDPARGGNGWTFLDLPSTNPYPWARALDVSDDGSVVVGEFLQEEYGLLVGFRWEDPASGGNGLTVFEPPPNTYHVHAVAVSGDGSVVIGRLDIMGSGEAPFYWTDPDKGGTGLVPLVEHLSSTYGFDLSDWVIEFATGISADGRTIVGMGSNSQGGEGWLARIELPCYADCDTSTGFRHLDVFDFLCFQNRFVLSETFACNCDTSTGKGVCDIFDFICFQDSFVAGCP